MGRHTSFYLTSVANVARTKHTTQRWNKIEPNNDNRHWRKPRLTVRHQPFPVPSPRFLVSPELPRLRGLHPKSPRHTPRETIGLTFADRIAMAVMTKWPC